MRRMIFWLITLLAVWGACSTFTANPIPADYAQRVPPPAFDSPANIAAGRELFLMHCVACHGVAGNGQGSIKPPFGPLPADLTDRTKIPLRTPQYLFWRLSEGSQAEPFRSQGSIMPPWKYQFDETQRWQVVAYLQTLAH